MQMLREFFTCNYYLKIHKVRKYKRQNPGKIYLPGLNFNLTFRFYFCKINLLVSNFLSWFVARRT